MIQQKQKNRRHALPRIRGRINFFLNKIHLHVRFKDSHFTSQVQFDKYFQSFFCEVMRFEEIENSTRLVRLDWNMFQLRHQP